MPRGRPSKDLTLDRTLNAIVARAATEIAHTVRQNIADEVARLVGNAHGRASAATPLGRVGRKRKRILCPVCGKPGGGPRWGWFCEDHRNLPEAEKRKIREARDGQAKTAVAARRKRRRKRA